MRMKKMKIFAWFIAVALAVGITSPATAFADDFVCEWREEDGNLYWYENGVKQGTEGRGKEIYDPASKAWYWLDAIDGGKKAVSKDVYQESESGIWGDETNAEGLTVGKWVRYDAEGRMVKGWNTNEDGTFYFDLTYGTMAKGYATIEGKEYYFNAGSGVKEQELGEVPEFGWKEMDGNFYWYEGGIRQGYSVKEGYRGKEIFDAESNAWYWLDDVDNGKKAVNKDVYQESEAGEWGDYVNADGIRCGKWVRYDENGHMIKGWSTKEGNTYYFDPVYGTMAKGYATIEGKHYYFNEASGVLEREVTESKDETENDKVENDESKDYGSGNITIWVGKQEADFTKEAAKKFLASNKAYSGYTVEVTAVDEYTIPYMVEDDVNRAADIYVFSNDNVSKLAEIGALTVLSEEDKAYSAPYSLYSGYFMYYDKSIISNPNSLEQMILDCEAAGKTFNLELNNFWYSASFFFGTGCEFEYSRDAQGKYQAEKMNFPSEEGLVALKEMIELRKSKAFAPAANVANTENIGVLISGTWEESMVKSVLGENFACAKLPTFTGSDGKTYQMGSYKVSQDFGVKPQTDANKLEVCKQLVQYLTSEEVQEARFIVCKEVPVSETVLKSVQAEGTLKAFIDQAQYATMQPEYPGNFWLGTMGLCDQVTYNQLSDASDSELMELLTKIEAICRDCE